jgi:CheW-like domain
MSSHYHPHNYDIPSIFNISPYFLDSYHASLVGHASAHSIHEVLPLMNLKRVPCAPVGVTGVLNYRGTPVPVIDLNEMTLAEPAARHMSTNPGKLSVQYVASAPARTDCRPGDEYNSAVSPRFYSIGREV